MGRRRRYLAAALLFAAADLAAAAPEPPLTINITATRHARTAEETLSAVTVIGRAEIEQSPAQSAAELLSNQPGVQLVNNGGQGKATGLMLRGTNSGHVLVLVDGMRMGSASLGLVSWQHLPLSEIERIEVVRGPHSHLYGSEAIGGVVQIFTRRGHEGEPRLTGEAGLGSDNSYRVGAGVSGGTAQTRYSLHVTQYETDGFNATIGNNPDRDGYEDLAFSGSLEQKFGERLRLRLSALRSSGENEYDGWTAADDYTGDFVQQVVGAELGYSASDIWEMTLSAGETRDEDINRMNGAETAEFRTRRRQLLWQNDLTLGEAGLATLGADLLRDELESSSSYSETSRDDRALFVQYQGELGPIHMQAGWRGDDYDDFGRQNTGSLALGYDITPRHRLTGSWGTAFKAPTFNDLYYLDPWGSSGNPDLKPEESESLELGLRGNEGWGSWEVRLFRNDIDDLIQWVEVAPWTWQPQNVAAARIDGLEAELHTELAEWRLGAALTLLDPRDRNTDNLLPLRSRRALRLEAARSLGDVDFGVVWRLQDERYGDAANTVELAGYGVVDLQISKPIAPHWEARLSAGNLFDQAYRTGPDYRSAGREVFLSVVYNP